MGVVLTARLLDRVGKGIRGAPRDALVADVTPAASRGAAFGLRQSLDSVGAFIGPLLAVLLMLLLSNDIQLVMWFAVLPAFIAVALIVFGVKETATAKPLGKLRSPITRENLKRFPAAFWWVAGFGAVFTLARFSEAFLVLRAQQVGMVVTWIPLVMVILALFYLLSAYPVGRLSDRIGRYGLLASGLGLLIVADLLLATGLFLAEMGAELVVCVSTAASPQLAQLPTAEVVVGDLEDFENAAAAADADGYYRVNHDFHSLVQAVAANRWLDRATGDLRRFMRLWRGSPAVLLGCIPSHAAYFSAYEAGKEALADIRKEIDILRKVRCPFIVSYFGTMVRGER